MLENNKYYDANSYLFLLLKKHIENNIFHWKTLLQKNKLEKSNEILEWIDQQLPSLKKLNYPLNIKCYWILNGIYDFPKCSNCNKTLTPKNFKSFSYGYHTHCCTQCAKDSTIRKERYAANFQKKYGNEITNPSQLKNIKDRKKQTYIEKFGVDNPAKSEEIRTKISLTVLNRYGKDSIFKVAEVIQKSIDTRISRYGVPYYSMSDEYTEKTKATNRKKFGVNYPNQDSNIRKSAQKKYHYDNISFDSQPEIALYIWLKDNNIVFEYQPSTSFTFNVNGKEMHYQPDFVIDGVFYEIKGLQFFKDKDPKNEMINPYNRSQDEIYEAKHRCMIANNIQILTEKDYRKYIDYVKSKYGKDYLKSFKTQNDHDQI